MKVLLLFAFLLSCIIGQSCAAMLGGPAPIENPQDDEQILGGLAPIEKDDELVMQAANLATTKVCDSVNSPFHLKLMEITEAQQQVVSGILYHLKVKIGQTDCLKSTDMMACTQVPGEHNLQWDCKVKVWYQAWKSDEPMKVNGEPKCNPITQ